MALCEDLIEYLLSFYFIPFFSKHLWHFAFLLYRFLPHGTFCFYWCGLDVVSQGKVWPNFFNDWLQGTGYLACFATMQFENLISPTVGLDDREETKSGGLPLVVDCSHDKMFVFRLCYQTWVVHILTAVDFLLDLKKPKIWLWWWTTETFSNVSFAAPWCDIFLQLMSVLNWERRSFVMKRTWVSVCDWLGGSHECSIKLHDLLFCPTKYRLFAPHIRLQIYIVLKLLSSPFRGHSAN